MRDYCLDYQSGPNFTALRPRALCMIPSESSVSRNGYIYFYVFVDGLYLIYKGDASTHEEGTDSRGGA